MKTLSKFIHPKLCVNYPNTIDLYIAEERLGYIKFVFDVEFMHLSRYAMSTDCISEFTERQEDFFLDWIAYNDSLLIVDIDVALQDQAIVAYDREWVIRAECIPDPGEIVCGNADLHTYDTCPV